MALAPRTIQNMPDCLRREAITVLHRVDDTEPTNRCWRRKFGVTPAAGIPLVTTCCDRGAFWFPVRPRSLNSIDTFRLALAEPENFCIVSSFMARIYGIGYLGGILWFSETRSTSARLQHHRFSDPA
jgi:hypothetical protein